jgi:SAM-dependent methyltransferase
MSMTCPIDLDWYRATGRRTRPDVDVLRVSDDRAQAKRGHVSARTVSVYRDRILPYLVHLSMRQSTLLPYRERVVSKAAGRVLEIGFGSGLNLPLYGSTVAHVIGLEPSPKLLSMASSRSGTSSSGRGNYDG